MALSDHPFSENAFCKSQQLPALEIARGILAENGLARRVCERERAQNPKGDNVSQMQINIGSEKEN